MDPVSRAQNCNETTRVIGRPFQKGAAWKGNAGGRPKKQEITKIYEDVLRKTKNRRQIKESVMDMLLSKRMVSVLLLREMAERTEGKVVQPVDVGGNLTISLEQVLEAKKKAGK